MPTFRNWWNSHPDDHPKAPQEWTSFVRKVDGVSIFLVHVGECWFDPFIQRDRDDDFCGVSVRRSQPRPRMIDKTVGEWLQLPP